MVHASFNATIKAELLMLIFYIFIVLFVVIIIVIIVSYHLFLLDNS